MFAAHHGRHAADKGHPAHEPKARPEHGPRAEGFTGLEGDFEEERRRAAAAEDGDVAPYEQDTVTRPTLPGSIEGLTHP
jgi:hypothetical protein